MAADSLVKNAMAFFDVQNLYRHAKDAFGHTHPNFDPIKLHRAVSDAHGWRPNLVRFYTGLPSVEESPIWHGYWANRLLALKRAGVIATTRPIRYRKTSILQSDGSERVVTTPQEKGIDVRLAVDLISLARKRQFDVAVIYSQDQDLCEVLDEVKDVSREQGRQIEIVSAFPSGPRATSRRGIDGTAWYRISQELYDACLDPRDYRPRRQ